MKISIKLIQVILYFLLFGFTNAESQISESQITKFVEVLSNINQYYTDSINGEKIVEEGIIATLKQLDPHSLYFSKSEITEINRGLQGSFEGVGISYYLIDDTIFVTSVVHGGPSEISGLKPGDKIVKIDKKSTSGVKITHSQIRELLSGSKGTEVEVFIKRTGLKKTQKYKIVRDVIPVYSINSYYMVNKEVGYIKLRRFSATSLSEFKKSLKELQDSGAVHLILDLQDNGGGYLHTAVDICDQFLKENKMIVYTEGYKSPRKNFKSSPFGIFTTGRLVVLIDEESASASEIVSGTIQDWDRGVLVGRRTYGKGLVQRPFALNDGSEIRLTTARYYTPCGRSIQKPYHKGDDDYYNEVSVRMKSGELGSKDSIKFNDSLKFNTLILNREIYGGGGITPDVFVPLDTLKYPKFYRNLFSGNLLYYFTNLYVDKNREFFSTNYSDFELFNKNYKIDNALCFGLLKYVQENSEDKTQKEMIKSISIEDLISNKSIRTHLKALIADCLWEDNEYFRVINADSEIFTKAVEIISDKEKYDAILK